MKLYLLSFVGSIFLCSLFGNYLSGLVLFFVLLYIYDVKFSLCLGYVLATISLLCFLGINKPGELLGEYETFTGEVLSSVGENKYEVIIGTDIYVVQAKEYIPLHSIVMGTISKITVTEEIGLSLIDINLHSLVYGEFNYGRWLYSKGYAGAILLSGKLLVLSESGNDSYRGNLERSIISRYGYSKEGGLLQGMMIGGRRGIKKESYTMFIDSGLVHIIAVSGSNIMMVVLFCNYLLFFVPIKIRRVILLCAVIFYFMVCGMDSSIFRATVFAVTNICVLFYGGRISFVRLLSYSVTILLCVNPFFLLYDLGFLLSVSALLGLYIGSHYYKTGYSFLDTYIFPSLFATLGVTPVLFLFVGKINLLSPLMTIVLGPFLSVITFMGSLSLIVERKQIGVLTGHALSFIYKLGTIGQQYGVYITISNIVVASLVSIGICLSYAVITYTKIKLTSKH